MVISTLKYYSFSKAFKCFTLLLLTAKNIKTIIWLIIVRFYKTNGQASTKLFLCSSSFSTYYTIEGYFSCHDRLAVTFPHQKIPEYPL